MPLAPLDPILKPPAGEYCINCLYWVQTDTDGIGVCHRYPPNDAQVQGQNTEALAMYWCVEGKKK